MTQQLIAGFGEALVDVLPSGEVVGGAPLNFAIRVAELSAIADCRAALVSRLGADERGEKVLARLSTTSLDTSAVQVDSRMQTGYVDVTLEDGQPSYTIGDEVAWDAIAWDERVAELAHEAAAVCFGTLVQRHHASRLTLQRFLETASAAHKILDINIRKPFPNMDVIACSLQSADILKCNEDELLHLAECLRLDATESSLEIAAELQQKFHLRAVFWTRGAQGCRWQEGRTILDGSVPQLPADPQADSVGAGDAASAALAVGLTVGWAPERIVRAANLCGAFAASRRGPTAPLTADVLRSLASE